MIAKKLRRTTHNIKQLGFSGLRAFFSRINFLQQWIRTRSENPTDLILSYVGHNTNAIFK